MAQITDHSADCVTARFIGVKAGEASLRRDTALVDWHRTQVRGIIGRQDSADRRAAVDSAYADGYRERARVGRAHLKGGF